MRIRLYVIFYKLLRLRKYLHYRTRIWSTTTDRKMSHTYTSKQLSPHHPERNIQIEGNYSFARPLNSSEFAEKLRMRNWREKTNAHSKLSEITNKWIEIVKKRDLLRREYMGFWRMPEDSVWQDVQHFVGLVGAVVRVAWLSGDQCESTWSARSTQFPFVVWISRNAPGVLLGQDYGRVAVSNRAYFSIKQPPSYGPPR